MGNYYGSDSTTAARLLGQCWYCGGPLYDLLVHHCGTVKIAPWPSRVPVRDEPAEQGEDLGGESEIRRNGTEAA